MSQSSLIQIPCPLCGEAKSFHDLRITNEDAHIGKYGKLYEGATHVEVVSDDVIIYDGDQYDRLPKAP